MPTKMHGQGRRWLQDWFYEVRAAGELDKFIVGFEVEVTEEGFEGEWAKRQVHRCLVSVSFPNTMLMIKL
jgi:hypothetical protein